MGFFVPILFENKIKNIKQFGIMMIILTIFVEILQFLTYRGSTDIDDVILNTIGAIVVYIIMKTRLIRKLLTKIFDIE
jgi:glycopeptide antibiotics resistance protein